MEISAAFLVYLLFDRAGAMAVPAIFLLWEAGHPDKAHMKGHICAIRRRAYFRQTGLCLWKHRQGKRPVPRFRQPGIWFGFV